MALVCNTVLLAASVAVAVLVWLVADEASPWVTLLHFLLLAAVLALFTTHAQRAVGEVQWGANPPL
jgi:membrane protein YdbS with pleckstrin-like domain